MENEFIDGLETETKFWLAHAIAAVVVSDHNVNKAEVEFLHQACGFLRDPNEINKLVEKIKKREDIELPAITIEPAIGGKILIYLAEIAVADQKFSQSEAKFLKYAGHKLAIDASYVLAVTKWAFNLLNVKKEQAALVKMANAFVQN